MADNNVFVQRNLCVFAFCFFCGAITIFVDPVQFYKSNQIKLSVLIKFVRFEQNGTMRYGLHMNTAVSLNQDEDMRAMVKVIHPNLIFLRETLIKRIIMQPRRGPKGRGVAPIGATRGVH